MLPDWLVGVALLPLWFGKLLKYIFLPHGHPQWEQLMTLRWWIDNCSMRDVQFSIAVWGVLITLGAYVGFVTHAGLK